MPVYGSRVHSCDPFIVYYLLQALKDELTKIIIDSFRKLVVRCIRTDKSTANIVSGAIIH